MRILIMGLPGAGKTTLAEELLNILEESGKTVLWLNADKIREIFNDWDFSEEGRIRQADRMRKLAGESDSDIVIADFVAPLRKMRNIFEANVTVWMDTAQESRFKDTDAIFEKPDKADIIVTSKNASEWAKIVFDLIDSKLST